MARSSVKSTKAEAERRVQQVFELLVRGCRKAEIVRFGVRKWGVKQRAIEKYITSANLLLEAEAEVHRGRELGGAIARLKELHRRAYAAQDYNTCRLVQKDLSDLLDLKIKGEASQLGDIPDITVVINGKAVKAGKADG